MRTDTRRPLVPEDAISLPRMRPSDLFVRMACAHVHTAVRRDRTLFEALKHLFPDDRITAPVARSASTPATLTGAGWASELGAFGMPDLISTLSSISAGAELIGRGLFVPMTNRAAVTIPGYVGKPEDAGSFVAENSPIPVRQVLFDAIAMTPRKLATICVFSKELAESSAIEPTLRSGLFDSFALALDTALFSDVVGSDVRPAGIFHDVVPIAATESGTSQALSLDIANLVDAITTAGGGRDICFIGAPATAASMKLLAGPQFNYPILASSALAKGTLAAVEARAFCSAFTSFPEFTTSSQGVLHMDDAPTNLVEADTAASGIVKSLFQTSSIELRTILRCSWAMRAPGMVQLITGVSW
jgi:hypothetical protein